ncbi:MAG: TIGR03564 family F420-dependent LLM class oxidoreductase [Chloroflexota bacterium]
MKIGVVIYPTGGPTIDAIVERVARAEARGFASVWMPSVRAYDTLTVFALAGRATSTIELASFVIPTFPRHPSALAEQALATQSATGGRLTLGIGLSHRVSMEGRLGFDWDHPVRHLREYLSCLGPLLRGEPTTFAGEEYKLDEAQVSVPGVTPPPVLVAALGPQLLRVTGRLADGTAIWMGGPRYIAEHAVPTITAAAKEAGRPAPRIVAGLPICVTDHETAVRAQCNADFERYGELPSYRAVLDRQSSGTSPGEVALIGNEASVQAGLDELRAAGVTDFAASIYSPSGESSERTYALLRSQPA